MLEVGELLEVEDYFVHSNRMGSCQYIFYTQEAFAKIQAQPAEEK